LSAEHPLRPDYSRSVEVFGDFTDELASRLLSQIAALQTQGDGPITVYINSDGGSVRVLDILSGLLGAASIERKPAHFVTVAVGNAASAGANLLAFGYYSYAHEHSIIHFHGVRTRDLPDTFESASQTVGELQRINRRISKKLAESIITRVMFRYHSLKPNFKPQKLKRVDGELAELHCFTQEISALVSPATARLIGKTFEHVKKSRDLNRKIISHVTFTKGVSVAALAADDSRVLHGVIKHELKENKNREWRIDERGINQIVSDYFVIREYNVGEHWLLINDLLHAFGVLFLKPSERKRFDKLKENKKLEFLRAQALPRFSPLWFFTVSLCRYLMEGENHLTPTDAFMIGVVDEVIGTEMTGRRIIEERIASKAKAKLSAARTASSAASPTGP
jgi:ATP-dependent protease ClpP protease subunit